MGETDYSEIELESSTHKKMQPEKKISQYRIIAVVFFMLFIVCLILLMCAVFFKFGCQAYSDGVKRTARTYEIKFFHVSDIHLDLNYNQSISSASYCRSLINKTVEKAPFDAPYGRVGCDIPYALMKSSLSFMKAVSAREQGKIKFFLLTGDYVAHDIEKSKGLNGTEEERILKNIKAVSEELGKAFPDLPILPSFGNHDLPGYYVLPNGSALYEKVLIMWQPLILCKKCSTKVTTEDELRKTFLMGGYYKAEIKDAKLTLLQLNSNYWVTSSLSGQPLLVANAQMKWLADQLKEAKSSGNRVVISGHIPIGIFGGVKSNNYWIKKYANTYIELVTKTYKDIVIGQLYGHTHFDDMRLQLRNDKVDDVMDSESSFLLTAPGITPVMFNNPGFRIFSFDTNKRMLADYHQYYMDLILTTQTKIPAWLFDYSFSDKYMSHLPEDKRVINGKLISDIVESFVNRTNENRHWQNYIQHRQVNYQPNPYSRYVLYCSAKHVTKTAFDECVKKHPVTGG